MAQDVRNADDFRSRHDSLANQSDLLANYSNWIKLSAIPGLGPTGVSKLRKMMKGSIGTLFALGVRELREFGFNQKQIASIKYPNEEYLQTCLTWLSLSSRHTMLTLECSDYPNLLKQISRPPLLLFCAGNAGLLDSQQIAIVGSRNPTLQGKETARSMGFELASTGWTVTSGLAMGIDGCSHQGALEAQGNTVAVLGTGIDNIYPKRHQNLAEQILNENGCIVSEFAPGTPARPENFPRRNRVVTGLSLGTLVVEATIKSGSLISARYALEQNREVFAVPGNIHNLLATGCHYLIKQGAKLVEEVSDINEEFQNLSFLQVVTEEKNFQKKDRISLATDKLLDSVDYEVTSLDVVTQRSHMSVSDVLAKLLEYELRGLVAAVPGGYIKLGGK